MFHNVSSRQGSSHRNRAPLNFRAFALRDMKIPSEGHKHGVYLGDTLLQITHEQETAEA